MARRPIRLAHPRRLVGIAIAIVAAVAGLIVVPPLAAPRAPAQTLLGHARPGSAANAETARVELGVRFIASEPGAVEGVRFYKAAANTGEHIGHLWTTSGRLLATATFDHETRSGWQSVRFSSPVRVTPGTTYVASYLAPHGRYSADVEGMSEPIISRALSTRTSSGVYEYGGGYPARVWSDSNYFVDVTYRPDHVAPATASAARSASSRGTTGPTPQGAPPVEASSPAALDLPRIPWEGGPDYWKRFSKAEAAGWDDSSFFPIVAWYSNVSTDAEVRFDSSLGVNTYAGMWEGTPYRLFADNDVFWIGDRLNGTFTDDSANWVGDFLGDEVDGTATDATAGLEQLAEARAADAGDGRFTYANFTQQVIGPHMPTATQRRFVNDFTDVTSLDQYFYTNSVCEQKPYIGSGYLVPIERAHCESSSSYGRTVDALREQDAADGRLQPIWQWVENLNGGPGPSVPAQKIAPEELQGAVMSSIIHEARGILYFNQSFSGDCRSSNVFRDAQTDPEFCGAAQVAAVKSIDSRIQELAPVINTQSYRYSFGPGLDTMLKTEGGDAYVFAMIDGSSDPGTRSFHLPVGVAGATVEVVDEGRTLPVTDSRFIDDFAAESSFHVYRIALVD